MNCLSQTLDEMYFPQLQVRNLQQKVLGQNLNAGPPGPTGVTSSLPSSDWGLGTLQ